MDEITPEQLRNAASKKSKKGDRATSAPESTGETNGALADLTRQGDLAFAQAGKDLAERHVSILFASYEDNLPSALAANIPTMTNFFNRFDLPSIEYQQIAALMGGV